jgi:hypothetical protein
MDALFCLKMNRGVMKLYVVANAYLGFNGACQLFPGTQGAVKNMFFKDRKRANDIAIAKLISDCVFYPYKGLSYIIHRVGDR